LFQVYGVIWGHNGSSQRAAPGQRQQEAGEAAQP
jgi:hypothetical protein